MEVAVLERFGNVIPRSSGTVLIITDLRTPGAVEARGDRRPYVCGRRSRGGEDGRSYPCGSEIGIWVVWECCIVVLVVVMIVTVVTVVTVETVEITVIVAIHSMTPESGAS